MECFRCEREAARECPRCGLLYCMEHGDVLCERCLDPALALPSQRLYRGALIALVAASVLALWLLLWPSAGGDGDVEDAAAARATPSPVSVAIASPTAPPTPATDATPTSTPSPTATPSPSPAASPTPTAEPAQTPTATPTATPAASPSPTATATPTATPTPTPTPTATPTPTPEPTPEVPRTAYIANTGGTGVRWRDECTGETPRPGDGWVEGSLITIIENGSGECEGWFRADDTDGVTSWVQSQYVSEEQP